VLSPLPRIAQHLFFGIGFLALAYAGSSVAFAEFHQLRQYWKFEHEIAALRLTAPAARAAAPAELKERDLIGKLEIPRIGISVMVLHGVAEDTLRLGAGHVPGTPLPGADGNSAIAAHRDTFFRKLEGVRAGDRIQFSTVRKTVEYVVKAITVVEPEDTWVMESRGLPELTLISCYPFYFVGSAPLRFIVHAIPVHGQESLPIEK
jgi:sortase A